MTLRELSWMAKAKDRHAWDHTSVVVTSILNSNPNRRKAVKVHEIHPYLGRKKGRPEGINQGLKHHLPNRKLKLEL